LIALQCDENPTNAGQLPVIGAFAGPLVQLLLLPPKETAMFRLFAACLAAVPLIAFGATIYKVQLEDGSILFTDSPPPGSKVLEERESKGPARAAPPRSDAGPVTTPESAAAAAAAAGIPPGSTVTPLKGPSNIDAAMAEVSAAERELAVTRRKLELGREPLPGERLGLKGGGTRLSPEYQARVGGLERDVAAAEARLKRAYEARNAAR